MSRWGGWLGAEGRVGSLDGGILDLATRSKHDAIEAIETGLAALELSGWLSIEV